MRPVSLVACMLLAVASASAQEAKPADDRIVELGVEGAPDYNDVVTAESKVVLVFFHGSQPELVASYESAMKKLKKAYKGDVVFLKMEFAKAKKMTIKGSKDNLATRLNVYEMAAMPHVVLIKNRGAVHNYDPGVKTYLDAKKTKQLSTEKQMAGFINTCLGPSAKAHADVPPLQCSPTGM